MTYKQAFEFAFTELDDIVEASWCLEHANRATFRDQVMKHCFGA